MTTTRHWDSEMKVGLFVSVGVGLIMLAIIVLGGNQSLFSKTNRYSVYFNSVDGLITGAKVVVAGLNVGTVEKMELSRERHQIEITVAVEARYGDLVRQDTQAEIATQGVLGDKYISLTAGNADQPLVEPGHEIQMRPSRDLTQFLSKSDQLMASLNSIAGGLDRILKTFEQGNKSEIFFTGMAASAKNLSLVTDRLSQQLEGPHLKGVLSNLHGILQKINQGNGTVGALVNDPALYDDAKSLLGGANRSKIVRNLVRKTIRDNQADSAEPVPAPSPKK